ncbi:MAG: hypothetical protein ACE5GA_05275, partial [Candidatus Zixiibacteriota bacterium]
RARLWGDYIAWASTNPPKTAGVVGNKASYEAFVRGLGIPDDGYSQLVLYLEMGNGNVIDSVTVSRKDQPDAVVFTVTSTGHAQDFSSETITSVYRVEGAPFRGFDYAILANNINCIMCHATIDNVDRVFNTDPTKLGDFDRVKIGSLESMLLRTTSAESHIAGALYTRGVITDKSGNLITDLSPSGKGLNGFEFSNLDGNITEPMISTSLVNTTGSPLPQYGNLYMNYPVDVGQQTDGALPDKFPPPFPDKNGNKLVDDDEYEAISNDAQGSLSGGIIYGVALGGSFSGSSLPAVGNITSIDRQYEGNLILVGTDANPIVLERDIAVKGDVIIQGKVKGSGQILAKGNIYITGDMTYADGQVSGNRTFGKAADGTTNAVSLAAGKNVLVGDYLTPKNGNLADTTSIDPGNQFSGETFSFAMSEITLFNRGEWTKTQQFLPDDNNVLQPNPLWDPTHKPRYYAMNDGDPVYLYNKQPNVYFDAATATWKGSEHGSSYDLTELTKLDAGDPQLSGAAIVPLSSNGAWVSPETLKNLWISDDAARAVGDEFDIDGLIYTNNSIFTLTRNASNSNGTLNVNGSLVAADIGVLAGTATNLNYDQRLKTFLKIQDESEIAIDRVAWYAE